MHVRKRAFDDELFKDMMGAQSLSLIPHGTKPNKDEPAPVLSVSEVACEPRSQQPALRPASRTHASPASACRS
jgi:hypothetical protein